MSHLELYGSVSRCERLTTLSSTEQLQVCRDAQSHQDTGQASEA